VLFNIPFGAAPDDARPSDTLSQTLVVVGMLGWRPNFSGIDRFLERSFPIIRSRVPGARLRIVGSHLREDARARWSRVAGVEVIGAVESVAGEYQQAALSVVPVFTGGGTKIKVLESYRHNRACVVSAHAHRGYEEALPAGDVASVASNDESFAEQCVALLRDPARRNRMAAAGRAVVASRFTFAAFSTAVAEAVRAVRLARRG